ncbi:hypothetical protein GCM10011579_034410 [Streptomyces albiflavescens]|uniref:Uncharacterized protein n=1 Tax=Streptomyces albiflavescens TaxID=1623582 RepID=A0A917Y3E0_9ACTN|nr:TetR/AcrR family transcriptional regulator [Streptomyces albiflavescens]GGN64691.1 hypothetical protein GCM10011579_034410 [Streptomyces albiflavescens]
MKRDLPTADAVKAAIDTVIEEAAGRGRRLTTTAVARRLGIPHATFHRHYPDLIDGYFRPRMPAPRQLPVPAPPTGQEPDKETNLSRLRRENAYLRRTLGLYEEAIHQLTLENDSLRKSAVIVALPTRSVATCTCHPQQPAFWLSGPWRPRSG